jgi:hypothetical protein
MDWKVGYDLSTATAARVREVMRHLRPQSLIGGRKIRIGRFYDGGYVMVDRFENVDAAYSLGINDDVSWDIDIARLGIPVFQYDHTIPGPPEPHPLFKWEPVCISGVPSGPGTDSLENLVRKNGHDDAQNLILKCDIEGAEWLLFQTMPSHVLKKFSQIVIEMHSLEFLLDEGHANNVRRSIMNLTSHHHVVHVHANNFAPLLVMGGIPIPNVVELTLLRKDAGTFVPSQEVFPTPLDMPCYSAKADVFLGQFDFG